MITIFSKVFLASCVFAASSLWSCAQQTDGTPPSPTFHSKKSMTEQKVDTATLAGGCFWCIEAVFQRLDGVIAVESGFSGGKTKNPTYKDISNGSTGHAEVCSITFDPSKVSYEELLHVFFTAHDPTTLNRQGNDVGTQYRSAIFYHDDEQREIAAAYIQQLREAKTWTDPIVTELAPFTGFYIAEGYHQNYYDQNGSQPYCAFVVRPKVEKFMKQFKDRVKDSYK